MPPRKGKIPPRKAQKLCLVRSTTVNVQKTKPKDTVIRAKSSVNRRSTSIPEEEFVENILSFEADDERVTYEANKQSEQGQVQQKPESHSNEPRSPDHLESASKRQRSRHEPEQATVTDIKHLESFILLIPKLRFSRLVREITALVGGDLRWQRQALEALHEATEQYIVQLMEDAYLCALHAKRVTLQTRDLHLALRIRGKV